MAGEESAVSIREKKPIKSEPGVTQAKFTCISFLSLRVDVEEVKVSYREFACQPLILSPQT